MMKLRNTIFLLIFFNLALSAYSNIYIVNTANLPKNEAFNKNFASLLEIDPYVNHWSIEWKYPADKSNLIIFLEAFHDDIIRINSTNDYELNLLNVVIMTYLYNLDETNYYNEISITVEKMKSDFPGEYRTSWLFGNFLISSAKTTNGYNEFKKILDTFGNNLNFYPVEFLDDYAYACILNQMLKTGMEIYEFSAERKGIPVSSNSLYTSTEKSFLEPLPDNNYTDSQTWEILKSNNGYYLRSRILGSLFPLVPTWNIRTTGLDNKVCFCLITPDRLLSKQNRQIGISILVEYNLNNMAYDAFTAEKRSTYPVTEQKEISIGPHKYNVYTFEDKSKYQNMGGAKGLYITTCIQYQKNKTIGIELPIEFNSNSSQGENNVQYYRLEDCFYRINQNINIAILVDSSNEIYDKASEFIFKYLERVVFE